MYKKVHVMLHENGLSALVPLEVATKRMWPLPRPTIPPTSILGIWYTSVGLPIIQYKDGRDMSCCYYDPEKEKWCYYRDRIMRNTEEQLKIKEKRYQKKRSSPALGNGLDCGIRGL